MPLPNTHICQIRKPGTLRVIGSRDRIHDGKKYRALFGIPRAGDEAVSTEYEYHYPVDSWTAAEARLHCSTHNGIEFHKATDGKIEAVAERLKKAISK
jgi:hypothetical protein